MNNTFWSCAVHDLCNYMLELCFRELTWVEEEKDRAQTHGVSFPATVLPLPLCPSSLHSSGEDWEPMCHGHHAVQKYPVCDVHCGFATIMYKGNHSMTVGLLHSCVLRKMTPGFPHRKHQNHVIPRGPRSCLPPAEAQMPAPVSREVPPHPAFRSPFSLLSSPTVS